MVLNSTTAARTGNPSAIDWAPGHSVVFNGSVVIRRPLQLCRYISSCCRLDAEAGASEYEEALRSTISDEIDIVLDYLWGASAKTTILALAKTIEDRPVRFVHVGGTSGEANIELPGAALRSAAIELIGSGVGSVSRKGMVHSISRVFQAVEAAGLRIATRIIPLYDVKAVWEQAAGTPRIVFTID